MYPQQIAEGLLAEKNNGVCRCPRHLPYSSQ
jgi:hypothetical protein